MKYITMKNKNIKLHSRSNYFLNCMSECIKKKKYPQKFSKKWHKSIGEVSLAINNYKFGHFEVSWNGFSISLGF